MPQSISLPQYLVQRFTSWKTATYPEKEALHRDLSENGQHPSAMVVSCCDSRVQVTELFGTDAGEFFIHRNIANLVPAYQAEADSHGTSAALEYAVTALKVSHILVVGHSNCGGVRGCTEMCNGTAPALEEKSSFLGRWLDNMRPGYEHVKGIEDIDQRAAALEKKSVEVSLKNLEEFPFIKAAMDAGELSLHGLWVNVAEGQMESFEPGEGFVAIEA